VNAISWASMLRGCDYYAWQFFWGLNAACGLTLVAVHAQLLIGVAKVLGSSEILQNILHVLITVRTCI
jgi:hypothetical protein